MPRQGDVECLSSLKSSRETKCCSLHFVRANFRQFALSGFSTSSGQKVTS
jgi:hypothetical protein